MAKAERYIPDRGDKKPLFIKGALLYIIPIPILFALFIALLGGNFKAIIANGIALFLFLLSAVIARKGFLFEFEYNKSTLSKAPKIKYKSISAVTLFFATLFASYFATDNELFLSILLAAVSFLGFYLYYGLDPMDDKISELNFGVNAEDVIKITNSAKKRVSEIKHLETNISDPLITAQLKDIIKETEDVIRAVEESPNDLSRARKFFNVYLDRAVKITREYESSLSKDIIDEKMRRSYIDLLKVLKETIYLQKERLNEDDITRLDVQIEALTKQIKNEGV